MSANSSLTAKCPVCKGTGTIEGPRKFDATDKRRAAAILRREGYSIRQIMRLLGYKSPRSVSELLEGKTQC